MIYQNAQPHNINRERRNKSQAIGGVWGGGVGVRRDK